MSTFRLGKRIALDETVRVAVDGHIEPRAENVLVDMTDDAGQHFLAVFRRLAGNARRRVDDAGRLHFEFDGAVDVEIPVHRVFVVPDGADAGDDELARAPDLTAVGPEVPMLPQDARIFLVDADALFNRDGHMCCVEVRI